MTPKEFAKKIIASINPGIADISGIGDGTIKGAISELNKNMSHGRRLGSYSNEICYGVNGFITNAGKEAQLCIPMCMREEVNNITIQQLKCAIRLVEGKYLGGALDSDLTANITNATLFRAQGIIRITLTKSDGWGTLNNAPFAGVCTLSYTMLE